MECLPFPTASQLDKELHHEPLGGIWIPQSTRDIPKSLHELPTAPAPRTAGIPSREKLHQESLHGWEQLQLFALPLFLVLSLWDVPALEHSPVCLLQGICDSLQPYLSPRSLSSSPGMR